MNHQLVTSSSQVLNFVESLTEELQFLSSSIWNRPELGYEETFAHQLLTDFLEAKGFQVQRSYHVPTAFRAEYSSANFDPARHRTVCFMSEYDALPEIGHACGHNLIAASGVAAALAVQQVLRCGVPTASSMKGTNQAINPPEGRVICLGTPAEESTPGGKIDLLQAGAFDDISFSLMIHPAGNNIAEPAILGLLESDVEFFSGSSKFCYVEPWDQCSAATDAAVGLFSSLSLLRQRLETGDQVHGVISETGQKSLLPEDSPYGYSKSRYYLRTPTVKKMRKLKQQFLNAVEAAAECSDCTFRCDFAVIPYEGLINNHVMARLYKKSAESIGLIFPELPPSYGSTDMGNVSNVLPSIHPMFDIGEPLMIHTKAFQTAAGTDSALKATLKASAAMAVAAIELLINKELAVAAQDEFRASLALCRGTAN